MDTDTDGLIRKTARAGVCVRTLGQTCVELSWAMVRPDHEDRETAALPTVGSREDATRTRPPFTSPSWHRDQPCVMYH